jgi:hypothetical protein
VCVCVCACVYVCVGGGGDADGGCDDKIVFIYPSKKQTANIPSDPSADLLALARPRFSTIASPPNDTPTRAAVMSPRTRYRIDRIARSRGNIAIDRKQPWRWRKL